MGHAYLFIGCFLMLAKVCLTQVPQSSCPEIYLRFSQQHSYCQPKSMTCDIRQTGVTDADKKLILSLHNSFRSIIATAQDKGHSLPQAADMLEMEWDDELAAVAQTYALQCNFAHDNADSRRVVNFNVGQNLAMQTFSGYNVAAPAADWSHAVTSWYEEIVYFKESDVCNFHLVQGPKQYGHFTQLIWSNTFRIGCGYTLYKEGDVWYRLYVCNYGPQGNIYNECVYKQGAPCSECPLNTCCGTSCNQFNILPTFPGLCTRVNDIPPQKPLSVPTVFHCDFVQPDSEDCLSRVEGVNNWKVIPALEGHFLEAVLFPGQNSSISFTKSINPTADTFCVLIWYRKGPSSAGYMENNKAETIYVIPSMNNYKFTQELPSYPPESRLTFSSYKLNLSWKQPTFMSFNFYVPMEAISQFVNIKSITAYDGPCQN